jgi:hypothetical protein
MIIKAIRYILGYNVKRVIKVIKVFMLC